MPDVNPFTEALQNSHEAVAARRNSTVCVQRERDTEAARLAWTCTAIVELGCEAERSGRGGRAF